MAGSRLYAQQLTKDIHIGVLNRRRFCTSIKQIQRATDYYLATNSSRAASRIRYPTPKLKDDIALPRSTLIYPIYLATTQVLAKMMPTS